MTASSPQPASHRDLVEVIAAIVLALAAVATAWSSYQANRWNGEQAKAAGVTNALRIDAARAQGIANNLKQADLATFIQWIDASASGNIALATFYEQRFRPEFAAAFDAWEATNPLLNSGAPASPFAMLDYRLEAERDAARLDRAASRSAATVQRNVQRSSNYVLGAVLFAVALFFGGMSPRMRTPKVRTALLAVGCTIFIAAVAWLATFPVTISV